MKVKRSGVDQPDRPNCDEVSDDWLRDEWWRANNPGASAARGLLWATAAAAPLWLALIATGFWVWSLLT
mgnify:CR=1 FL=1